MRLRAVFFVIAASLSTCPALGETPKEQFLKDYKPHAERLRDAFSNVSATCKRTVYRDGVIQQIDKDSYKFGLAGVIVDGTLELRDPKSGEFKTRPRMIFGQNQKYEFRLTENSKAQSLALSHYKSDSTAAVANEMQVAFVRQAIKPRTYLDYYADPVNPITEYKDSTWQGRQVKEVVTKREGNDPESGRPTSSVTSRYFDPAYGWAYCGEQFYDIKAPPKQRGCQAIVQYRTDAEGLPVLVQSELMLASDNKFRNVQPIFLYEFTDFVRHKTPFPESDFTLAAYGLPEPSGQENVAPAPRDVLIPIAKPETPTHVWALVAAGICVVISTVAVLIRRRNKKLMP